MSITVSATTWWGPKQLTSLKDLRIQEVDKTFAVKERKGHEFKTSFERVWTNLVNGGTQRLILNLLREEGQLPPTEK